MQNEDTKFEAELEWQFTLVQNQQDQHLVLEDLEDHTVIALDPADAIIIGGGLDPITNRKLVRKSGDFSKDYVEEIVHEDFRVVR